MPTYEYVCTKCGHRFEVIQSMMEKPLSRCPVCKSAIRRVINGGIGVIFKGRIIKEFTHDLAVREEVGLYMTGEKSNA